MVKDYPLTIRHISGHTTEVLYNATLYKNEAGQVQGVFAAARDVTEHNRIEKRARITNVLLELFAQKSTRKEYLDSVVRAVRDWSGCQCVGIRLTNSDGLIPYESHIGFNKEFLAIGERAFFENRYLRLYAGHYAETRTPGCTGNDIERFLPLR